jgi:hypothetical protein
MFKSSIKDIMTGYRAFSYQFVKTFPVLSRGFEIETEMSIHAIEKNLQIENVVIEYRDRPEGSDSKLNTYSDGIKVLRTILRLYRTYHPLSYFSCLAGILAIIATIFLAPVLNEYACTGVVLRFPTLIVCCFVYIAAIISFFSGMVLSSIQHKNKYDFEQQLILLESKKRDCNEKK